MYLQPASEILQSSTRETIAERNNISQACYDWLVMFYSLVKLNLSPCEKGFARYVIKKYHRCRGYNMILTLCDPVNLQ